MSRWKLLRMRAIFVMDMIEIDTTTQSLYVSTLPDNASGTQILHNLINTVEGRTAPLLFQNKGVPTYEVPLRYERKHHVTDSVLNTNTYTAKLITCLGNCDTKSNQNNIYVYLTVHWELGQHSNRWNVWYIYLEVMSHWNLWQPACASPFTLPVMLLPGMGTNPDVCLSSNCEITLTQIVRLPIHFDHPKSINFGPPANSFLQYMQCWLASLWPTKCK